MNIIKYRGNCKTENKLYVGSAVQWKDGSFSIVVTDDLRGISIGKSISGINPDTVQPMSPWVDAFDRNIFAGDILELTNCDGEKIRVVCVYGKFKRNVCEWFNSSKSNLCEIAGFSFAYESEIWRPMCPTFPIVKNYMGVNDTAIMKIVGRMTNSEIAEMNFE